MSFAAASNLGNLAKKPTEHHMLQFYNEPPQEELNLEDFAALAISRKNFLQELQAMITQFAITSKIEREGGKKPSLTESRQEQEDVRKFFKDQQQEPALQQDHTSHFILALCSCDNENRRKIFVDEETLLFRWRAKLIVNYQHLVDLAQEQGLQINKFDTLPYFNHLNKQPAEIEKLPAKMADVVKMLNYFTRRDSDGPHLQDLLWLTEDPLYSVPQAVAFDIFTRDKHQWVVYQKRAHFRASTLVDVLTKLFRERLDAKLVRLSQHITRTISSHPLLPSTIRKIQFGDEEQQAPTEGTVTGPITAKDLPLLSQQNFPLCMSRLFNHVNREHHTRYGGRGQLNLFFKAIGLPFDQALEWWRHAFSPKFPGEKFDKEYRYSFAHNYGLEGKRASYSAPSCARIINEQVAPQDAHGCPFKHLAGRDPRAMQAMLTAKIAPSVSDPAVVPGYVDEIMKLCVDGHYQIACTSLWRFTHKNTTPLQNIVHPTFTSHKVANFTMVIKKLLVGKIHHPGKIRPQQQQQQQQLLPPLQQKPHKKYTHHNKSFIKLNPIC